MREARAFGEPVSVVRFGRFTAMGALLVACVRATAPTATPETATVTPVASVGLVVDPSSDASAMARSRRDASDREGLVLDAITVLSPTERTITRAGLDLVFEDASILAATRVVPEIVDGSVTGVRIFGVRSDSVMSKLGFENGDRVEAVNGRPISDPAKALEAYASLRGATLIEVDVVRRGAPIRLVLRMEPR